MPEPLRTPPPRTCINRHKVMELVWSSDLTESSKGAITDAIQSWHDRRLAIERERDDFKEALQALSLWADDQEDDNFDAGKSHTGWLSKREHFTTDENRRAKAMLYDD